MNKKVDWKQLAKTLKDAHPEMTTTAIADMVGKSRETVRDYFTRIYDNEEEVVKNVVDDSLNARILIIPDQHAPFHHKDTLDFLEGIKKQYNPTRVINLGDEADGQSLNFHGVNPDLMSSGCELDKAKEFLHDLHDIFPVMDLVESNHTSLAYRRAFKAGMSKKYLKSYQQLFEVGDGWVWHDDLLIELPNKQNLYVCHGKSADGLKLSKNMACNVLQGHHHSKFAINYWSNPQQLYWSLQAGCLIDDKALTFAYNKLTMDRPIIGAAMVVNSHPILIPMEL